MATPSPAAMAMAAFVESPPAAAAPSAAMATPTLKRVMPKALKSENNFLISVLLSSDLCLPLLYPHPRNDGPSLNDVEIDALRVHVLRRGRCSPRRQSSCTY